MTEIIWDDGILEDLQADSLILRAVDVAKAHENRSGSVDILITTPEEIQRLNREFRHVDSVTDVLSFPSAEGDSTAESNGSLGDIAICLERAKEQANLYGHSFQRELAFLTVHGCLHLMGYDHMIPEDEQVMRAKQTAIMEELGFAVS